MAIKIRLRRAGKPGRAFYHIVVADGRFPRDGRFIEKLGYYDPVPDPVKVEFKTDRAIYWLSKGAKPSPTVFQLFRKRGVMAAFKKGASAEAKPEAGKAEA